MTYKMVLLDPSGKSNDMFIEFKVLNVQLLSATAVKGWISEVEAIHLLCH